MKPRLGNYILAADGRTPVLEPDTLKWAIWFESSDRTVRQDQVGNYSISTIFLSVDHNWHDEGDPILWETMTFFGGSRITLASEAIQQRRYSTYEAALAGHEKILEHVKLAVNSC